MTVKIETVNAILEHTRQKITTLEPQKLEELKAKFGELEPREIIAYQELKSIAQMENKISFDVAMWMYRTINGWNKADLADKVVFSQLIAAMLQKSVR